MIAFGRLAQLGERASWDREIPGSIPGVSRSSNRAPQLDLKRYGHTKVLLVFQLGERRWSEEEGRESSVSKGPIKGAEAGKESGMDVLVRSGGDKVIVTKVEVGREAGKEEKVERDPGSRHSLSSNDYVLSARM